MPYIHPTSPAPTLTIFSNAPTEQDLPHIRDILVDHLAEISPITCLALSHTCTLYRDLCTKPLTPEDVVLNVGKPSEVLVWRRVARRRSKPSSKGELWFLRTVQSKPMAKEKKMVLHHEPTLSCYAFDPYGGVYNSSISTPSGLTVIDAYGVFDMCFGRAVIETWELPSPSAKRGFTMMDLSDIVVGRYKRHDVIESGNFKTIATCWGTASEKQTLSLVKGSYGAFLPILQGA